MPTIGDRRNILLLGRSGSGKTRLIRALTGLPMSTKPTPHKMTHLAGVLFSGAERQSNTLDFVNTGPFCDSNETFEGMTEEWNTLVKFSIPNIHFVVVTVSARDLESGNHSAIKTFIVKLTEHWTRRRQKRSFKRPGSSHPTCRLLPSFT